jgi:hypothetical protein
LHPFHAVLPSAFTYEYPPQRFRTGEKRHKDLRWVEDQTSSGALSRFQDCINFVPCTCVADTNSLRQSMLALDFESAVQGGPGAMTRR